jgi:EAL domain-containing protein (putative c-di-GMP-specific phosphodiesterase class I)
VSGDEFVFLCEDLQDETDAEVLAERVNTVFLEPFVLQGTPASIAMTASIGIAYAGPGEDISDQLVVEADMAMYQVKRRGGRGHQIIDMREALRTMDLHRLERDLRSALVDDELEVAYQPIMRNPGGTIAGVEALLRWNHPARGPIPPPTIIAIAEQCGLISDLGAWVLERACRDHARWLAGRPGAHLDLAVNVSARQLLDPDFPIRVSVILARNGLAPTSLVLEVTESIFIEDNGVARRALTALEALGIRLALDDFGTGYSSLSYLCRLPIHIVKIDRSFISDLDHVATKAIVTAITGLAHDLDLEIVAEGIETQDQAARVVELGCEYAQGFWFARPMSADDLAVRLDEQRLHSAPQSAAAS